MDEPAAHDYVAIYDHSTFNEPPVGCGFRRADVVLIATGNVPKTYREVAKGPHSHCMVRQVSGARVARLFGPDEREAVV